MTFVICRVACNFSQYIFGCPLYIGYCPRCWGFIQWQIRGPCCHQRTAIPAREAENKQLNKEFLWCLVVIIWGRIRRVFISRNWGGVQTKHFGGDRIEQRSEGSGGASHLKIPGCSEKEHLVQRPSGESMNGEASVTGMRWERRTEGDNVVCVGRSQSNRLLSMMGSTEGFEQGVI